MTASLNVQPDNDGYTYFDFPSVSSQPMPGGLSALRLDFVNNNGQATLQWTLSDTLYQTLVTFYGTNGTDWFNANLIVDSPDLTTHLVHFLPNGFGLNGVQGLTYTVGAQIEVQPLVPNDATNLAIVAAYEALHP